MAESLISGLKSRLSKVNFAVGRSPSVRGVEPYGRYIPVGYKAVILLAADFELAWAWRFCKDSDEPKEGSISLANRERANIPRILEQCEYSNIPITWLTVGHLFLNSCSRNGHPAHPNLHRLPYFENAFWKFERGDWFDDDPSCEWQAAPQWYAPDLIREILSSDVNHEIGCHTFSHIDCRDGVCPATVFEDEIRACQQAADRLGIRLHSFVHPAHTIGNLAALRAMGFTSFRSDNGNILGYPERHPTGLWEMRSTAELARRPDWSLDYHLYRYEKIVERAIRYHKVCYLWFHPSLDSELVDVVLPQLFGYLNARRRDIWITTTQEYVEWLNEQHSD